MLYEVIHGWHIIFASIGCISNLLLCYVALLKTPKATRSYATLIVNFAITDFSECFLDLFLQIRLSLFYHCFPHTAWSLLLSFTYRYYILHHPPLTRKTLSLIILVIYIPSIFQAAIYWPTLVDRDEILPYADKFFPQYNLSEESGVLGGITTIYDFASIYVIIHICVPIFPIYIIIFILRGKIVKDLMEKAALLSNDQRVSHNQILKCLTIQALIPSFFLLSVCSYISAQLGIFTHPVLEYSIFASIIMMPVLSSFTYLVYIRPYRVFCLRLLGMKRRIASGRQVRFGSTAWLSSTTKYTVSIIP